MSSQSPSLRSIAAPVVIAAAVIAGAHIMFVAPARQRLALARTTASQRELDAQRLQAVQSALPTLTAVQNQAKLDAAAIERGNTPARDTGILFATLAELASRHRVRVDQLDPFTPRPTAPAPAAGAAAPVTDVQLGYSMTIVATYDDLAAFLSSLQTELGYTRILSARIAPNPEGPETVTARIQSVHHAFTLPNIGAHAHAAEPEDRP